jgi:hypothetical protein
MGHALVMPKGLQLCLSWQIQRSITLLDEGHILYESKG